MVMIFWALQIKLQLHGEENFLGWASGEVLKPSLLWETTMIKISPGKEPQGCFRACLATNIHHYLQRLSKMFVIDNIFLYQTLYAVPLKPEGKICFFSHILFFWLWNSNTKSSSCERYCFFGTTVFQEHKCFHCFCVLWFSKKKNGNTFLLFFFQTFSKNERMKESSTSDMKNIL